GGGAGGGGAVAGGSLLQVFGVGPLADPALLGLLGLLAGGRELCLESGHPVGLLLRRRPGGPLRARLVARMLDIVRLFLPVTAFVSHGVLAKLARTHASPAAAGS